MKPFIKQNSFLVIKLAITYILLTNSVKFFTYFFDPYSFRFASFVDENKSLENSVYKTIVFEYSKTLFNQEVVYFSFFILFLIVNMLLLAKAKHSTFSYFFIGIVLYLIQRLDLTKFNNPQFLGLIPKNICGDMKSYLFINGVVFLCLGIIFFLITFRKMLFHNKESQPFLAQE